ncbi:Dna repair rad52-like protein 1 protein [Thalictrum thalictroides]|uniref:Dna repair rad52-like protein 1 protein n=1 Tax=Thalictrum thalictroides TaxID=46969 RepID=A0A7J6XDF2_THATH|nr:Dna repair rad52-like protein 1 protein [Thalictrum thalictroides]
MASLIKLKSILQTSSRHHHRSSSMLLKSPVWCSSRSYARGAAKAKEKEKDTEIEETVVVPLQSTDSDVPIHGITRPLSHILKDLSQKIPDSFIKVRVEDGFSMKYVPWHVVNWMMNTHAPEWSGEVRSITYSPDGKSVSVVYRVTIYGIDAEIYRESSGTASSSDTSFGDPVQKAEAMAFRRACARLGLGLHLYHEDL